MPISPSSTDEPGATRDGIEQEKGPHCRRGRSAGRRNRLGRGRVGRQRGVRCGGSATVEGGRRGTSRPSFENTLPQIATDIRGIGTIDKALPWLCEEDPDLVVKSLIDFLA
jgi:hypothetical protein